MKQRILFICHGNICRSTMAEFVMKHLVKQAGREDEFEIASAATSREEIGHDTHYGTKEKLREKGVPFAKRQAVQMTKQDYQYYDLIVAMDRENLWGIRRIIGDDILGKVRLLLSYAGEPEGEVADPWSCTSCNTYYSHNSSFFVSKYISCSYLLRKVKSLPYKSYSL